MKDRWSHLHKELKLINKTGDKEWSFSFKNGVKVVYNLAFKKCFLHMPNFLPLNNLNDDSVIDKMMNTWYGKPIQNDSDDYVKFVRETFLLDVEDDDSEESHDKS